jgi:tRNA A37 methylthiotransferase MiaB
LIEERHQRCLELVDRIAQEKRLKRIGTVEEVLVEEDNFGRTRGNYKVHLNGNTAPGEVVRIRVTSAQRATLEGEVLNGNVNFENFREEDSTRAHSRE